MELEGIHRHRRNATARTAHGGHTAGKINIGHDPTAKNIAEHVAENIAEPFRAKTAGAATARILVIAIDDNFASNWSSSSRGSSVNTVSTATFQTGLYG